MREAYASVSWAFGRGENVEQCEREHYSEKLDAQRGQGCRIEGGFRVNKVIGNFHIAPGRSFSNGAMHVHDLNNYLDTPDGSPHTFTHQIHHLRFGPQVPESVTQRLGAKNAMPWTNHHLNPLDQTEQVTDDPAFNYMYFVKVVSTSYLPLGWQGKNGAFGGQDDALLNDLLPVGSHGRGEDGSLETHQYSVTSHKRSLSGGSDSQEGHKERLHARRDRPVLWLSRASWLTVYQGWHPGRFLQLRHIANESYQQRRANEVLCGFPHGCLRGHRRHFDCRSSDRSGSVRGSNEDKENASAVILAFVYHRCHSILFESKVTSRPAPTGL